MRYLLRVILFLFCTSTFAASNSNPGLYYGQVPTPAQWNSYFSTKLDYNAGSINTVPYWDGSGNLVSAAVSGDCTATANVFTCPLTNSAAALFAAPPVIGSTTPSTAFFAAAAGSFTGVQVGTGSGVNTGLIIGNEGSGVGSIWSTAITPSVSNYTLAATATGTTISTPSGNISMMVNATTLAGTFNATGFHAAAGTTTLMPIQYISGTNNTTPTAGAVEYDGNVQYFTPVASNRGVALTEHFVNNSAAQTGTNVATAQPWFVTTLTNGQITLPASTTYEFEGVLAVSTTGTTSHALNLQFGGTATITSMSYSVSNSTNATSFQNGAAAVLRFSTSAASFPITVAVATATYDIVEVKGTLRVNAAGTFIPQFIYSSAPGVAPVIAAGTYFRIRPLGTNAVTSVGNWN